MAASEDAVAMGETREDPGEGEGRVSMPALDDEVEGELWSEWRSDLLVEGPWVGEGGRLAESAHSRLASSCLSRLD